MTKIFLLILFLMSSCIAMHHGSVSEAGKLGENEKVVDIAHGFAKVNRVLFFGGGLGRDALIADAKKNLLLNHPLQEDQYFANYIVDFKETFVFPGIFITKTVLTADVIGTSNSDYLQKIKENENLAYKGFHLGQKVSYYETSSIENKEATILEFTNGDASIGFINHLGKYKIKRVSLDKIKSLE